MLVAKGLLPGLLAVGRRVGRLAAVVWPSARLSASTRSVTRGNTRLLLQYALMPAQRTELPFAALV